MDEQDRKEQKERRKLEELERIQAKEELKWVLSTEKGRNFLWRLLFKAALYENAFHQHNGVMSYALGRQSIGQELLLEINQADPDAYFRMMSEHKEDA